jgi:hypothetical protein
MSKESRRTVLSKAALSLPLGAVALAARPVAAAPKGGSSATTFINSFTPGVGGFTGTLTMTGFQLINGVLSAVGTLAGTVLDGTGTSVGTVTQSVTAPVSVSASCTILALTLGPLHLNLLGLVIDLNQVVLNITAVPGAGNLLGNLLCAVADLLNSGSGLSNLLNSVVGLLNQILGAL